MRELIAEPLTAEAFAPFGDVIEASDAAQQIAINYGNTTRFHDLAQVNTMVDGGKTGVSIFRSTPLAQPFTVNVMEYHPKSSQAFVPLSGKPYLVVVAPKGEFDARKMRAFLASGQQGVNYHAGTWHHFSLALEDVSDFLVIDRIAEDDNCVEYELLADEQVRLKS
ncbi:MAG: ureidoglycolate lyase [Alphaproteobacteria bacterium]|nr:ureidoglycolate lyase [Alphaproteobacteria bacterium]